MSGRQGDLAAYEDDVLTLLERHGARLVARVQNTEGSTDQPSEVQIIDLPSEAALAAYLDDPGRLAMEARRAACVSRTEVMRVRHT